MATVTLEKIARRFAQVTAVSDISFEVPNGEFWVMVGPSGCGKSTILRAIAGLESITEGNLYFDGKLMNKIPARERDVAMVFQNYALYPHLTVAENLSFGLRMKGEKKQIRDKKVQSVAEILNIAHLLNRKPKQLSGGQQQRVALGRAIIRQPQVFLLDEPLSNLDAQLREQTRTEIKKLHQQVGITTIYVTHDQIEAMTLGDRIIVLHEGKIQQIGTPKEVYHQPRNQMVATFLGNPPMNIIPVKYDQGMLWISLTQNLTIEGKIGKIIEKSGENQFNLGIRPEFFRIITDDSNTVNNAIVTVVEVIEPLGKEILVNGKIVDTTIDLNLLLPFSWDGKIGDVIRLQLDLNQVFLFNSMTGDLID